MSGTLEPTDPLLQFVCASAALMHLRLDCGQAERVAAHLRRTAAMAELLEGEDLAAAHGPAQIFCPAPFTTQADQKADD
jgi:hypothetical protein